MSFKDYSKERKERKLAGKVVELDFLAGNEVEIVAIARISTSNGEAIACYMSPDEFFWAPTVLASSINEYEEAGNKFEEELPLKIKMTKVKGKKYKYFDYEVIE